MKITMETQGEVTQIKTSLEISDDSDINDAIDSICGLLVAYGYHPQSVSAGIISKAEEYQGEDNINEK